VKGEAGKRFWCEDCQKSFRPPEDDDDDDEPRIGRKAARKGPSGVKITATVVGSLLALGLLVLVAVLIVRKGRDGGDAPASDTAKVGLDTFKGVQAGMALAEVEGVLGAGRSTTVAEMRDEARKAIGGLPGFAEAFAARAADAEWRRWEGKNLRVWVAFAKTRDGRRAAFSGAIEEAGGKAQWVTGFATEPGTNDLDKVAEDRRKETALRNDPKWVRGPQARDLLPGEWRDEGAGGYQIDPGGKIKDLGVFPDPFTAPVSYRFIDDRIVELAPTTAPLPAGFPEPVEGRGPRRFELLVNREELMLVDAMPQPLVAPRTFYRMPAAPGSAAEAKLITPWVNAARGNDTARWYEAFRKLKTLGKNAAIALPALTELLRTPDQNKLNETCGTIAAMKEAALPALPALLDLMQDPRRDRCRAAIKAFGGMGSAARDALPALRDLRARTTDGLVRLEVDIAVRAIEGGRP
jgi:hypothetical protein